MENGMDKINVLMDDEKDCMDGPGWIIIRMDNGRRTHP